MIALLCAGLLPLVFISPAQAVPSPTLTLTAVGGSPSCIASGQTVFFEMVGRNLDPSLTYSGTATDSASNVWLAPTAPRSPSLGLQWGQRFSYTGDGTSTVLTASLMSADPTLTETFNIVACGSPAPSPAASPAADEVGPEPIRQGVPEPDGGCEAVKDEHLSWGTGLTGGWQRGWEHWENYEGWACIRVMEFNGTQWVLADRSAY